LNVPTTHRRRRLQVASGLCLLLLGPSGTEARPGDLDASFAESGVLATRIGQESEALQVVVQDDGRIVVGGIVVEDQFEIGLARFLPDGSADREFGSEGFVRTSVGTGIRFSDLVLQADGRIVVGATADAGQGSAFALLRYDTDGRLDASFGDAGIVRTTIGRSSGLEALVLQADGGIVAAGRARVEQGTAIAVARYHRDGALDSSFGDGGTTLVDDSGDAATAAALALQMDGRIVVAGASATPSGGSGFLLARLDERGVLDPTFGEGGIVRATPFVDPFAEAFAVAIQPDGRIVAAGVWGCNMAIGRYSAGGNLDSSWGSNGFVSLPVSCDFFRIRDIAIAPTGKVVVPGSFDFSVAQITSSGALDPGFGSAGRGATTGLKSFASESVAIQSDGSVVVAGRALVENGEGEAFGFAVARFVGDGRQSRVETSPDGRWVLVSKDVGSERWAIARNTGDGSVTGNVFRNGGGALFVWCADETPRGEEDEITLSCFGAGACAAAPCPRSDWRRLSEVTLPGSFFAPGSASEWLPIVPPVVLPGAFFEPPAAGTPDPRASSVQIARDRASVLVNKDVGVSRWAIQRSFDDGAVSGNVFDPTDGSAQFVWCTPDAATDAGAGQALSCALAARRTP